MTKSILATILDPYELSVRFQPIFQIRDGARRVDSVEALIRGPRGTNFENAEVLFDYVRRKRAEAAVDQSCTTAICDAVKGLPSGVRVNINVHAATLGQNPEFADFFRRLVQKQSLDLQRFTIELVEHAPTCHVPEFTNSIAKLRSYGIRIALDDVGLGQSNYRMMLDCHPEFFKLDAYFVHGLSLDPTRRAVVASLVALAKALDSSVVAEGVASNEDLAQLETMGVNLAQANFLCPAISLKRLLATGYLEDSPSAKAWPGGTQKVRSFDQHRAASGVAAGESFYT